MREVQTLVWCDNTEVHTEESGHPRVPAHHEVVLNAAGRPMHLDLCDSCNLLLNEILDGWASMGSPANQTTPVSKQRNSMNLPTQCPECDHNAVSRSALGQHLKHSHNTGFRAYHNGLRTREDYPSHRAVDQQIAAS